MITDAEIPKILRRQDGTFVKRLNKKQDLVQELRKRNPYLNSKEDIDSLLGGCYIVWEKTCDELEKMQKEIKK